MIGNVFHSIHSSMHPTSIHFCFQTSFLAISVSSLDGIIVVSEHLLAELIQHRLQDKHEAKSNRDSGDEATTTTKETDS